jgi:hypothetical protein
MSVWAITAMAAGTAPSRIGSRSASARATGRRLGVPQHPGRQVDADRGPAQLAERGGVDAGAAAELQAGAVAVAEEVAQGAADVERVGVGAVDQLAAKELVLVPVRDRVGRRWRHRPPPLFLRLVFCGLGSYSADQDQLTNSLN